MILHDQAIAPLVHEMMGATALAPHWTFSWPPLVFSARLAGKKQDATTLPLPALSSSFFANFWRRFLTQICQCFTGVLPTPINQPQWCKWWCSFQMGGSCIYRHSLSPVLDSIVVSIPACHAGDRGSIPRRGGPFFVLFLKIILIIIIVIFRGSLFFFEFGIFYLLFFFHQLYFQIIFQTNVETALPWLNKNAYNQLNNQLNNKLNIRPIFQQWYHCDWDPQEIHFHQLTEALISVVTFSWVKA